MAVLQPRALLTTFSTKAVSSARRTRRRGAAVVYQWESAGRAARAVGDVGRRGRVQEAQ